MPTRSPHFLISKDFACNFWSLLPVYMLDLKQYYHDALRKCGYGKTYSHSFGDGIRTQTQLPSGQRGSKAWKCVKQQGSLIAQSQERGSTRERSFQTWRTAELLLVSRWSHTLVVKIHLYIEGNLLSGYYLRASRTNMPWLMPIQLFVQSVPLLGLLFWV